MTKYEESTVLEVGARGKHAATGFELVSRTVVKSDAGGIWNEWVLRFDDGRVGFLAEARGWFTLVFEQPIAPARGKLVVGAPLDTGFLVTERGAASRIATWGEPQIAPKRYEYADLSSRDGETATIDYGEGEPHVFVGRRFTLKELGLAPRAARPKFLPVKETSPPRGLEPCLSVGDEGTLAGVRWRVIGLLQRSIRIEGERYTWEEYLLHDPANGFRWLVVSDGHWNLVEGIDPGRVTLDGENATFDGVRHELWSEGKAKVEWAAGEMPWEVTIGDTTDVKDYVKAPHVLSWEKAGDEIVWSRGVYTPPETIAKGFGKRVLPKPQGRAPNQPRSTSRR
ncbi:MAG TPA: DUF4178 domain-containing protein [Labilithrix sp.]